MAFHGPDYRDPMTTIAVTGATGAVGGRVAHLLADAGVSQRLLVRDPSRAPRLAGAQVLPFHYADDPATRRALDGVDVLFMVSAHEDEGRLEAHCGLIDAAAAAGVHHVVYTSFQSAAPDAVFTFARTHWATEEHLRASGMATTMLRDCFYQDILPSFVGEDGVLRGPAGTGRVAAVARADVAACAATILADPEPHADHVHELTGPEALDFEEIAAILSSHLGRHVTFHDETIEEAYQSRRAWPAPQWQYDAWVSTYTAIAAGQLDRVSDDVPTLLGRPATSLAHTLATASASS